MRSRHTSLAYMCSQSMRETGKLQQRLLDTQHVSTASRLLKHTLLHICPWGHHTTDLRQHPKSAVLYRPERRQLHYMKAPPCSELVRGSAYQQLAFHAPFEDASIVYFGVAMT